MKLSIWKKSAFVIGVFAAFSFTAPNDNQQNRNNRKDNNRHQQVDTNQQRDRNMINNRDTTINRDRNRTIQRDTLQPDRMDNNRDTSPRLRSR